MDQQYLENTTEVFSQMWIIINEMSPYLLLGFLLAGVLHVCVPRKMAAQYFKKANFRSILNATLFAIPIPLCSNRVVPTAMGLRREGASKGATVSFLVATPQTGIDSLVATYSVMGLPFALIRPVAAFITAIFTGILVTTSKDEKPHKSMHTHQRERKASLFASKKDIDRHKSLFSYLNPSTAIKRIVRYAFVDMIQDVGKWLFIGVFIAGAVAALIPDDLFKVFVGDTTMSILLVLVISIPMYICATGSIPISMALILKGLTPGAGLVLLMTGPASNLNSLKVIRKTLGVRVMLIYLGSLIVCSCLFGVLVDEFLPRRWFIDYLQMNHEMHCSEGPTLLSLVCTIILLALMVNAFFGTVRGHSYQHTHSSHGHSHHGHHHRHKREEDRIPVNHSLKMLFKVSGMSNRDCAETIESQLGHLEGIEDVEVSLHRGQAIVVATNVTPDLVISTISSLGYEAELLSENLDEEGDIDE